MIVEREACRILARSNAFLKPNRVVEVDQTITTTPTTLDLGALSPPFTGLFIKNTDADNTLTIDSDSAFTSNPQVIPAGKAIYLNPNTDDPIYAKSSGPIQIQTIVGVHDVGTPGTRTELYARFLVNVHNEIDGGDFLHLGDGGGNIVAVFRNNDSGIDRFWFYYQNGGTLENLLTAPNSFLLDTWYTVDMRIIWGASIICYARVDGIDVGSFNCTGLDITTLQVGGLYVAGTMNHQLDSFTLGTTGYGSSDLFSADFSSTIIPPFASTTGSGLSISSGTLLVTGTTDTYATKAITFP